MGKDTKLKRDVKELQKQMRDIVTLLSPANNKFGNIQYLVATIRDMHGAQLKIADDLNLVRMFILEKKLMDDYTAWLEAKLDEEEQKLEAMENPVHLDMQPAPPPPPEAPTSEPDSSADKDGVIERAPRRDLFEEKPPGPIPPPKPDYEYKGPPGHESDRDIQSADYGPKERKEAPYGYCSVHLETELFKMIHSKDRPQPCQDYIYCPKCVLEPSHHLHVVYLKDISPASEKPMMYPDPPGPPPNKSYGFCEDHSSEMLFNTETNRVYCSVCIEIAKQAKEAIRDGTPDTNIKEEYDSEGLPKEGSDVRKEEKED